MTGVFPLSNSPKSLYQLGNVALIRWLKVIQQIQSGKIEARSFMNPFLFGKNRSFSLKSQSQLAALGLALLLAGCAPDSDSTAGKEGASATQEIGPDHIEITHRFEVGKRYVYGFDMTYETNFGDALGGMMPKGQGATQYQEYAVSVLEATDSGGKILEFEFLRNKFDMDMGGMKAKFDSAEPADPNDPSSFMFESFNKILDHKITIEIDKDQEVISVSGIEKLREAIVESAQPQIASMVNSMSSEVYIENMTVPRGLPMNQVKPGDSWPSNITQNLGVLGTLIADQQFQFKKMENHEGSECALIAFSGTLRGRPSKENTGEMAQMMNITGGSTFGKQWYDPNIGQFTDSAIQQEMKMKMTVPGLPAEAMQGGGLTVDISQKLSRKLIRIESIDSSESVEETEEN